MLASARHLSLEYSSFLEQDRPARKKDRPVIYVCYFFFAVGIIAYAAALFFIGQPNGETFSDVGNAVWLLTAVLLLLRLSHQRPRDQSFS